MIGLVVGESVELLVEVHQSFLPDHLWFNFQWNFSDDFLPPEMKILQGTTPLP